MLSSMLKKYTQIMYSKIKDTGDNQIMNLRSYFHEKQLFLRIKKLL